MRTPSVVRLDSTRAQFFFAVQARSLAADEWARMVEAAFRLGIVDDVDAFALLATEAVCQDREVPDSATRFLPMQGRKAKRICRHAIAHSPAPMFPQWSGIEGGER